MRRACYCSCGDGFQVLRLVAVRKDGNVETKPIEELSGKTYKTLEETFVDANRNGYGIVGSLEDIRTQNSRRLYLEKCGDNMMSIDDL